MIRKALIAGALGVGMLSAAVFAEEHAIQGNAPKWAAGPPRQDVHIMQRQAHTKGVPYALTA